MGKIFNTIEDEEKYWWLCYYYDQLESVLFHLKVILGLNAFTCLLLLLAIFR